MSQNKRRILVQAFKILFFSYCPLVWMLYSRKEGINNTELTKYMKELLSHFIITASTEVRMN